MSTDRRPLDYTGNTVALGNCPTCAARIDLTPRGNIPAHASPVPHGGKCNGTGKKPQYEIRPCRGCGFELKWADLGTGVVHDTSMQGVPGGPFPEFVPGDRTYCLRCITGIEEAT